MPAPGVHVKGLNELIRAFDRMEGATAGMVRQGLAEAGEPVRETAEELAAREITNIGPVWYTMRLGVTTRVVYVAPATRRKRGAPRPNLGTLLMERAMLPALQRHTHEVIRRMERLIDRLAKLGGF